MGHNLDREAILSAVSKGQFKPDRKRLKTTEYENLDHYLLVWFNQARACNTPISGPVLFEKGAELAQELGLTDFKMDRGWIDRFKDRHGIGMKVISGEAASAPTETTVEWRGKELQDVLKEYYEDILNADETGLFYKRLPNKTLALKGDTCTGQKIPKERISILVAANMDGSQKLPPLIIGKFERPRNIPASEHLSLREIAAQSEKTPFELEEDEDEDIESGKEQAIVSNNEAESAISTLRLYLQQHESTPEDLTLLNNMERRLSKIMTTAKKQSSIKSFFKPIQKDSHQM
ncbi:tigger transposable element-derived protein 6 [Elysia marginata]|uniref:Tigger transposable element-derived protein 6 n=1 Tax=Elysia marginata TaxID=1093978 RepID=A0AAV4F624_9GAST|nr:tigger transposable element-derived protein 6 [Elysia marginata]